MAAEMTAAQLIEKHRPTLDQTLEAIRTRAYWSPHPEHPKAYGESAAPDGLAAFEALRGRRFELDQPGTDDWTGEEVSPYGLKLDISYPHPDVDVLLPAMRAALPPGGMPAPRRARRCVWRSWPGSAPGPTSSRRP